MSESKFLKNSKVELRKWVKETIRKHFDILGASIDNHKAAKSILDNQNNKNLEKGSNQKRS